MTTSISAERRFLSREELELIAPTHHPKLVELEADDLRATQTRLRDMRDKAKTVARHKRREARGKGPTRAAGASGNQDHAARRKQIFSQALRRTNRQLQRLEHAEARAQTAAGAQKALAMKRRADGAAHRPNAGQTPRRGMRSNPSLRRAMEVNPAKVGSVSQATKRAQAKRDNAAV